MQFYYLDPQGQLLHAPLSQTIAQPFVDLDVQWLSLGHRVYPKRLHSMECFERLTKEIPEDHQFAFRQWYESRTGSTHCIWYSLPKNILKALPDPSHQAKSLIFVLQKFFPPSCRNQSVLCFVDLPECELVVGYQYGHCVCFKKLPPQVPIQVQHEWMYLQQTYPQWTFDHSVYLSYRNNPDNPLIQTHQHTIQMKENDNKLANRIFLYGLY